MDIYYNLLVEIGSYPFMVFPILICAVMISVCSKVLLFIFLLFLTIPAPVPLINQTLYVKLISSINFSGLSLA